MSGSDGCTACRVNDQLTAHRRRRPTARRDGVDFAAIIPRLPMRGSVVGRRWVDGRVGPATWSVAVGALGRGFTQLPTQRAFRYSRLHWAGRRWGDTRMPECHAVLSLRRGDIRTVVPAPARSLHIPGIFCHSFLPERRATMAATVRPAPAVRTRPVFRFPPAAPKPLYLRTLSTGTQGTSSEEGQASRTHEWRQKFPSSSTTMSPTPAMRPRRRRMARILRGSQRAAKTMSEGTQPLDFTSRCCSDPPQSRRLLRTRLPGL